MSEPQDFRRRRAGQPRSALCGTRQRSDEASGWSDGIRALYDGVVQEPLPPDFVRLLDELQKKTSK